MIRSTNLRWWPHPSSGLRPPSPLAPRREKASWRDSVVARAGDFQSPSETRREQERLRAVHPQHGDWKSPARARRCPGRSGSGRTLAGWNGQPGRSRRQPAAELRHGKLSNFLQHSRRTHGRRAGRPPQRAGGPFHPAEVGSHWPETGAAGSGARSSLNPQTAFRCWRAGLGRIRTTLSCRSRGRRGSAWPSRVPSRSGGAGRGRRGRG